MLIYALRRALWAIPTLFGISLVVFFVTTLIPDPTRDALRDPGALLAMDPAAYEALEEERRTRSLDLPSFFNTHPSDVRIRAEEAVRHVAANDALANIGAYELGRLGGAALPYVLPQLDKLAPPERARVAVALAPIAERMGEPSSDRLRKPEEAVLYWSRFWEDRSLDFTEPAMRRAIHRLVIHSTELREHDVLLVDTYALPEIIPAMATVEDRDALRTLATLASRATGRAREIPEGASDDQLEHTVDDWQTWWRIHHSDYTAFDGLGRVAAAITETRYGRWVLDAATGRLGSSARDGQPIYDKLRAKAPITLALTLLALFVSYAVAIPFGAFSAWSRGRAVDVTVAIVLFAMYSFPTFWAAQLLAHTFAVTPNAGTGALPETTFGWIERLAAPVFALSLGALATLSRYQRAATLEVIGQDYVRAARAKGASPLRLVVVHALRNSMIPTVTLAGLQFPTLLGGAFVVEEVFGVPGMGYETLRAVEARDSAWLVATILLTAIVTTAALIASDVAYGVLDPRTRESIARRRSA